MNSIELYSFKYYITLSAFMFIFVYLRLCVSNDNTFFKNNSINSFLSFLLLFIIIAFIGFRDPEPDVAGGYDTKTYTSMYREIANIDFSESEGKDIGFFFLMKLSNTFGFSIIFFYLMCAFLYIVPVYMAFKKWFSKNAFYALAMYITAMSFWSFGINGVRNGLAVSLFIYSLRFIDKKWIAYIIMAVSVLFHKSMLLPIIFFLFFFVEFSTKKIISIWFVSVIICLIFGTVIGDSITSLLEIIDTRAQYMYDVQPEFLNNSFRFDFIIYSSLPILLGYYYIYKKKYSDRFYIQLLNTYILTNAVWILFFMYVPFSNRYAYLSWCIMPIIIIYPLLKERILKKQYKYIGLIILGNLLFTILMFLK